MTPSFNQADFLEEAIRSVLLQGVGGLRYTVVDGGSTDHSVDIIRRYEPWLDSWTSMPDGGQADALNRGFSRTPGEILGWLNSDDVLYPGFLAQRLREFNEAPEVGLIYGDVDEGPGLDKHRVRLCGEQTTFREMIRTLRVPIPQQSALWRRSLFEAVGGLDPRWQVVLDRDFFVRAARHGRLLYRPGVCALFRSHPRAKSSAMADRWVTELPEMYRELFADPSIPRDITALRSESMMNVAFLCAVLCVRNHRFGRGAGALIRSFASHPRAFLRDHVVKPARRRIERWR